MLSSICWHLQPDGKVGSSIYLTPLLLRLSPAISRCIAALLYAKKEVEQGHIFNIVHFDPPPPPPQPLRLFLPRKTKMRRGEIF